MRVVANSLVLVRGMMMRGDYVTIMSDKQIEVEQQYGILAPLAIELKDSARPIGLTYRANWRPTPTQARFLDMIREQAA